MDNNMIRELIILVKFYVIFLGYILVIFVNFLVSYVFFCFKLSLYIFLG